MLSLADRQLIKREPELPGLSTVLDDTALLDLLHAHEHCRDCNSLTINYLRYKPNANCLVGCVAHSENATTRLYAVAYHPDAARDKLASASRTLGNSRGNGVVDHEQLITALCFPVDQRLPQLAEFHSAQHLAALIGTKNASYELLSYKPLRRCVTRIDCDGRPQATLRCLLPHQYAQAKTAAKYLPPLDSVRRPNAIGHSDRHSALVMPWIEGVPLSNLHGQASADQFGCVGAALSELHSHVQPRLQTQPAGWRLQQLNEAAAMVCQLLPEATIQLQTITKKLSDFFSQSVSRYAVLHGDFHADQVIVGRNELAFLDWDRARNGDPESDLASFLAHELVVRLSQHKWPGWDDVRRWLLAGYREQGEIQPHRLNAHLALELVKASVLPFRRRHADWPSKTQAILDLAEAYGDGLRRTSVAAFPLSAAIDPGCQAPTERQLAEQGEWLQPALDPDTVIGQLAAAMPATSQLKLTRTQALRLKPGRRMLLQYDLRLDQRATSVLGKVQAKGADLRSADIQARLYDLVCNGRIESFRVARPLGVVPPLRMWLQEPIAGISAAKAIQPDSDTEVSCRVAKALAELHRLKLSVRRQHTHADELDVLRQRLTRVAQHRPEIAEDALLVLQQCEHLLGRFPKTINTGIHRDFYAAQVILLPADLVALVDFDLFAVGDPLIDVGNFLAHLKESAIRQHARTDAMSAHEAAFTESYLAMAPWATPEAIQAHTVVSLARHIHISWALQPRQGATDAILHECLHLAHQMNQQFAIT